MPGNENGNAKRVTTQRSRCFKTKYRVDHAIASITQLPFVVEPTHARGERKPSAPSVAVVNTRFAELDWRGQRLGEAKEAYSVAAAQAQVIWPERT